MVFNSVSAAILGGLWLWLVIVTYLFIRLQRHYRRLASSHGKNLQELLEEILTSQQVGKRAVQEIQGQIEKIEREGAFHVQRIGLVRFNPFADTGGAQSFTLALLDKHASGVVMTSLYGRTVNRWYAKEVVEGKGKDVELSKEEVAAIKNAEGRKR